MVGVIEAVGSSVTKFKKGDRVVSDTPAYQTKETKYGCWQKYVVGRESTTAKLAENTSFEDAAAIPFALLTAVAALHLKLGMPKPSENGKGTVLIWGASGSVGGYAVQYAASVSGELKSLDIDGHSNACGRPAMTWWQLHRRGNSTTSVALELEPSWTIKTNKSSIRRETLDLTTLS